MRLQILSPLRKFFSSPESSNTAPSPPSPTSSPPSHTPQPGQLSNNNSKRWKSLSSLGWKKNKIASGSGEFVMVGYSNKTVIGLPSAKLHPTAISVSSLLSESDEPLVYLTPSIAVAELSELLLMAVKELSIPDNDHTERKTVLRLRLFYAHLLDHIAVNKLKHNTPPTHPVGQGRGKNQAKRPKSVPISEIEKLQNISLALTTDAHYDIANLQPVCLKFLNQLRSLESDVTKHLAENQKLLFNRVLAKLVDIASLDLSPFLMSSAPPASGSRRIDPKLKQPFPSLDSSLASNCTFTTATTGDKSSAVSASCLSLETSSSKHSASVRRYSSLSHGTGASSGRRSSSPYDRSRKGSALSAVIKSLSRQSPSSVESTDSLSKQFDSYPSTGSRNGSDSQSGSGSRPENGSILNATDEEPTIPPIRFVIDPSPDAGLPTASAFTSMTADSSTTEIGGSSMTQIPAVVANSNELIVLPIEIVDNYYPDLMSALEKDLESQGIRLQ
ncbi:hypothetical protein BKA69DRAFT_1128588 [Paraphysoderma sedebokerense]|nr:hypothetical protein BKA69DRAFT_1128588 [Paraphysoderma sedebokerense]